MDYPGRRNALRRRMAERGADLVAIAPGPDMQYLLGFYPRPDERPCYLFVTGEGEGLVVPELNASETAAT